MGTWCPAKVNIPQLLLRRTNTGMKTDPLRRECLPHWHCICVFALTADIVSWLLSGDFYVRKETGIDVHWKCKAYTDNFLLQDKILNLEKLYPQVDFNWYYTCFYQMVVSNESVFLKALLLSVM